MRLVSATSCTSLIFRRPVSDDWDRVMAVMPEWWAGRDLRAMLPHIFFEHFRSTSLIAEHEGQLLGFLVGFLCRITSTRLTSTSSVSSLPGAGLAWRATSTGASAISLARTAARWCAPSPVR